MDKNKNGVFIFLGVAIILVGFAISAGLGSISDSLDDFNMNSEEIEMDLEGDDVFDEATYELIVEGGVLYMWDPSTGEVWKKEADSKSRWEEIEPLDRWE